MADLNVRSFYGPKYKYKYKKFCKLYVTVDQQAEYFKINPIPSYITPRISGPPLLWHVFSKQQSALDFAKKTGEGLMTFSFESKAVGENGQRKYIVTHPCVIWKIHSQRNPIQRCTYEVIPEGHPCKLYFDLEYDKELNSEKDGAFIVELLMECILYLLCSEFNISCSKSDIIDLDSSTSKKFSRHLIFKNVVFANNEHAGNFVKDVCEKIKGCLNENCCCKGIYKHIHSKLKYLFVKNKQGQEIIFCDLGVYTKNRNFRIYKSTKLNKNSFLSASASSLTDNEEQFFIDSLVSNVLEDSGNILYLQNNSKSNKISSICTDDVKADFEGHSYSPFPEIDKFIMSLVYPGYIRAWLYYSISETLVYEIAKFRFCINIKRVHKSNNIYYVIDIKRLIYYQKCHDPECLDFRSEPTSLPESVQYWKDFNDCEIEFNDENDKLFELLEYKAQLYDGNDDLFELVNVSHLE